MIERSESTPELDEALSDFQKKAPKIIKEKLEEDGSSNIDRLNTVLKIIRGLLFESGLVFYQEIGRVDVITASANVRTFLFHKSGEMLVSNIKINDDLYRQLDVLSDHRIVINYVRVMGLSECFGLSQRELGLNAEDFLK